ncbi:hypothetical protein IAG41_12420 [Sphingomonas sp. JC676]|uniref:hypothetical protein n=1 Tax=Sphingomonas sp. JC676 TaxID=2768065 RepID=UPI0016585EFF|nr:hypothetical protein [Sphingomonas sp. JC676]MBC9033195.1 hypothetical protein [Sphingomonas sp. JC676]
MDFKGFEPGKKYRYGWYRPQTRNPLQRGNVDPPVTLGDWIEYQRHTSFIPQLKPIVIDFLALDAEAASAATLNEDVVATLGDDLMKPITLETLALAQRRVNAFLAAASGFEKGLCIM